ncbi:efflux RND transporter periplasmic adaptor subunit [Aminivibrio sp.]|jgi:RND family efflux transporter MFP subunit|uniref:efflux RND transporter periplasmic adaptor subunit n=1 Tax=Aminivibrio sp. TaxID=1872489 RepID=UPI001A510EE7|nr:efflux RND transporter periplasmic adaptor subunit [Aminivibrio sp.]MBL3539193.1 efflux RND transporter periplasmic adaptor subunit [Aminivibrio sp.]
MTSPEQINNTEKTNKPKSKIGRTIIVLLLMAALAFFGKSYLDGRSNGKQPVQRQPQAPAVVLSVVEKADLAVGREYIGRVDPIQTVSLKPQISGEIEKVHFKEGSMVKAGQLLFTIDDRQYKAMVALRKAELAKAEATYDRALKYDKRLKAADVRSVSASDIELSESDVLQGKAAVEQAKAMVRLAEIDLGYTRITAPIAGQIGEALLTKGNYVTPSSGDLTTIVQIDPIRVTFSLPDKEYLDQLEAFKSSDDSVYDATVRLANGKIYPAKGARDFENNVMDEKTGTIRISLLFENTQGFLVPGAMVRVMAKPAKSRITSVIPQEAILADAEGDFVYSVDANDIAHKSRVKLGEEFGTMREVVSGLEPGERIILRGLQSVRPEVKVRPVSATNGNDSKTPAERAMESDYDLKPIVSGNTGGDTRTSAGEGK